MAKTKKFSKQELLEMLDTCGNENSPVISNDIVDTSRWHIHYRLIFKDTNGNPYLTYYSVGATEQQETTPFEHDNEFIECTRVYPREKTITVYEVAP